MKRRVAIALLATSFTAGAAGAADRPVVAPQPYYAGPLLPVDWTGFYIGVNGGYGWAQGTTDTYFLGGILHGSGKPSGGVAGGQIGFNWQAGRFVFGAEIDGQWSGQRASFASTCNTGCSAVQEINIKTFATGRGRFGLAFDWLMPYVTAGAAVVNVSDAFLVTSGGLTGRVEGLSGTSLGWTAGAGVDIALTSNLSARLEYLYLRVDDHSATAPVPNPLSTLFSGGVSESGSFQDSIVRVGLNYRFGPRGGPGVVERRSIAPASYASAYDFLPSVPIFADRSRSDKRAPTAPMVAETPVHAPAAAPASTPTAPTPVAVASANASDFRLPATAAASAAANEPKSAMLAAVAAEPRTAKSAYKNFDEIEDDDLTGGTPATAKAITLPSVNRRQRADDTPSLKRIMSICSGC